MHNEACFVTLTYADEHLPHRRTLEPRHLQLFLKRLRRFLEPTKVRFFAVGEYGDTGERAPFNPHYHCSLFGVSGRTEYVSRTRVAHYGVSAAIQKCWPYGGTDCQEFNEKTAQYVAGYTTKKLTSAGDAKLGGRHPEFMRSSRNPGLGASVMRVIADTLDGKLVDGDVPHRLMLGTKSIPLGRYLLARLRSEVGMTDEEIQEAKNSVSMERSLEMLALFKNRLETEAVATFRNTHVEEVHQKILQAETRYKLWSKKRETL